METIVHASIGAPHPECAPGEVFLTYANGSALSTIGWKSKRTGERVFDIGGREVTGTVPDLVPVFVKRLEVGALLH